MATIHNTTHLTNMQKALKLAPARETMPNQLADKVLPVFSINHPYNILVKSASGVNATSTTIFTTSTTADTYIVGASLSMIKDVTATSTITAINVAPFDQAATNILSIIGLTLTVQNDCISQSFPIPIKVARGANVNITHTTNVGNVSGRACIEYYEVPD